MSLDGNLSDLSLSELLQALALCRKSGVLEIRTKAEVAWLGLQDGGVVRVASSERDLTPEKLLVDAGLDSGGPADAVEAALWEAAIAAIVGLFEWREGDFSFDSQLDPQRSWSGPEGLVLSASLSPEFLALEGARVADESQLYREPVPEVGEALPTPDPEGESEARRLVSAPPTTLPPAVIAVDRDPDLLAAVKSRLSPQVPVHAFQRPDEALERVKHYAVRGLVPTLVLSQDVPDLDGVSSDGGSGIIGRVRRMIPGAHIVLLRTEPGEGLGVGDCELGRFDPERASQQQRTEFLDKLATAVGLRASSE